MGILKSKIMEVKKNPKFAVDACPWHPITKKCYRRIRYQFQKLYPADLIFQDQVGAKPCYYDTNKASPTPYAYTQGLLNMANEDSKEIPLATENGFDRLINFETIFCGCTSKLVPGFEEEAGVTYAEIGFDRYFGKNGWEFSPLPLWLAHDKVIFTLQALGHFVTRKQILSWVLGLGFQISCVMQPTENSAFCQRLEWIRWLHHLQRKIAAYYLGKKLISFRYLASGVFESKFETVRIVVNTRKQIYPLTQNISIAPFGFYMERKGCIAGILSRFYGIDYGERGLHLVLEKSPFGVDIALYAKTEIPIKFPRFLLQKSQWQISSKNIKVTTQKNTLLFHIVSKTKFQNVQFLHCQFRRK